MLKRCHGFTLVEMLVVLVLVVLAGTILTQALSFTLQLQSRYDNRLRQKAGEGMHNSWWRQSVFGLLAQSEGKKFQFKGDAQGFSGISSFSLEAAPGVVNPVAWRFEPAAGETRLKYQDTVVFQLPDTALTFAYRDAAGKLHDRWPPQAQGRVGKKAWLPSAILILADERVLLAAPVSGPQMPMVKPGLPFVGPGI